MTQRKDLQRVVLRVPVILVLCAFSGCTPREGRVTGKATLNSQPLARAQLRFHREGDSDPQGVAAATNDQGEFRVIGFKNETIPAGEYRITAVKMTLKDGTVPEGEKLVEAQAAKLLRNSLPRIYEDVATTPLKATIVSGANVIQLELKK